jgi:hypothetical protein
MLVSEYAMAEAAAAEKKQPSHFSKEQKYPKSFLSSCRLTMFCCSAFIFADVSPYLL